jgi:hypothetical protein
MLFKWSMFAVFIIIFMGGNWVSASEEYSVQLSGVSCVNPESYDDLDRRCVFTNLISRKGRLFYVYENVDPNITAIRTGVLAGHTWRPRAVSREKAIKWSVKAASFENAILFKRLNSQNWYHHLFDDYQLLLRLRWFSYGTSYGEKSDVLIIFQDLKRHAPFVDTYGWLFTRKPACLDEESLGGVQIPKLAVGAQSTCDHRIHCTHRNDEGSWMQFREAALINIPLPAIPAASFPPKVGVFQRPGLRKIVNIEEVMATVGLSDKQPVILKDDGMAATLFSSYDIIIMMHGGSIGNWLFLKPGAVVIDFTPYGQHNELTSWFAEDLSKHLGVTIISMSLRFSDTVWTKILTQHACEMIPEFRKACISNTFADYVAKLDSCPVGPREAGCKKMLWGYGDFRIDPSQLARVYELAILYLTKVRSPEFVSLDASNFKIGI